MEGHHHPDHHRDHATRKRWSHYFFEFFMLFLAVVAGFLVENQREHYIEHMRAKQFAKALHSDLISDTSNLTNNISWLKEVISSQDKMILLMRQRDSLKIPGATLYYYAYNSGSGTFFSATTATLQQLKNSGSLRYFKSIELIRLVNQYDQVLANQFSRNDVDMAFSNEYRQAYKELFSFDGQEKVIGGMALYPEARDSILALDIPLLSNDKKLISNYLHALENRRYNLSRRVEKYYSEPLDAAILLISSLKKEYHFK